MPWYGSHYFEDNDYEDQIPGGLADEYFPDDFDPEQLALGIDVELEHTGDIMLAREIAMDHLVEDPFYYDKLLAMEQGELAVNPDPLSEPERILEAIRHGRMAISQARELLRQAREELDDARYFQYPENEIKRREQRIKDLEEAIDPQVRQHEELFRRPETMTEYAARREREWKIEKERERLAREEEARRKLLELEAREKKRREEEKKANEEFMRRFTSSQTRSLSGEPDDTGPPDELD